MTELFAYVFLGCLALLQIAGLNVLLTKIVHQIVLALDKNVKTLVWALVDSTLYVTYKIISQYANVLKDMKVIPILGAMRSKVSANSCFSSLAFV